ncbi:chitinase [Rhodanobacter sp. FW510-R12]|uniref:glycoside hydrolase family 19 protein n=1 Tax=unclassified Rhodanobacter TaxID=2621553 RepID=UPI0007A9A2BA|nr:MULTISPECIES: glycoside hydrolase family 19 protein [unclassified Rhodanobacter]KZC17006.1 chitinase [Rhodanobacter sp. FW104-R8]KZC28530.1 chitinase [Rhodanobacter sp. FW510-T8]KZC32367.1 chitinase [Rhodanobacter sp. FW510-R10]
MNVQQLADATGATLNRALLWLAPLVDAMHEFGIDTPARRSAFLAQIGHESGGLRNTRELWGPTPAQVRYEGRADLGNTQPGDGSRYRGRGLIQITGRANYAAAGKALHLDLIGHPEILEEPDMAALSAAWWWTSHGLNALADKKDFVRITRIINGGTNGLADRLARWDSARKALGVAV